MMHRYFVLLVFCISKSVAQNSQVTDEDYALMPPLFYMDDYDRCMLLKEKALYCYTSLDLRPSNISSPSKEWTVIEKVSSSPSHYRHDKLRHFLCIPESCPHVTSKPEDDNFIKEIQECLNKRYENKGLEGTVSRISCKTSQPIYQVDVADYVFLFIFLGYTFLVVILSFYDLYKRYGPAEKYKAFRDTREGKIITAFSIPSNWSKLKSDNRNPEADKLRNVQGIRVYMTFLVIQVHTATAIGAIPISNPQFIEKINNSDSLLVDIPKRGIFLLSFYFMMSTWVLISSLLYKADKKEPINIEYMIKSVIKRYIRFIPSIVLTVGFYATWFRHIPFGPIGQNIYEESERCRKNGWANLLFIQSYVDRYFMCHIITWYLGIEMQYYIISLLLIAVLLRNRNKIPYVIAPLILLSTIGAFWDHYRHGYTSELAANPEDIYSLKFNKEPQWHDHFASYHANFVGSLIGLIFGYLFYETRTKKIFTTQISIALWWITSLGLLVIVFITPRYIDVDATPAYSAFWVAMTRPLFAIAMGLLVFGMSHGLGGALKWIFEFAPLYVLAKLTFMVYVTHTIFQNIRVGMLRQPEFLGYYPFFVIVVLDITIAFLAAVPLTLLFELPAHELAILMFKNAKSPHMKKEK